ncbi:MAG: YaaL family protein [Firmicutes bacterium]|nr:YaaL family protein [Bacillota bacterium]
MRWKKRLTGWLDAGLAFFLGRDEGASFPERHALTKAVEQARREWQAARSMLDNVTDPRLIDYAVFAAGAAERKYMFLLDEARRQGIRGEFPGLRWT